MNRRDFLKLSGMVSGTTLAACELGSGPARLIPHLVPPDEGVVPGTPTYLHTTCTECPAGCGLMVKVMDGRPVKLEGTPGHPLNDGALCIRGQAGLERLYHPERFRTPMVRESRDGKLIPTTWEDAFRRLREGLESSREKRKRSALMAGRVTGPLRRLAVQVGAELELERITDLELLYPGAVHQATRMVFGLDGLPDYRLDRADLAITLGADLLGTYRNPVLQARRYAQGLAQGLDWWHLEPHLTLTGLRSRHRLTLRPASENILLTYLLRRLKGERTLPDEILAVLPDPTLEETAGATGLPADRIQELLRALQAARRPLLMAGGVATSHFFHGLRPAVTAALIQWILGMDRSTVDLQKTWDPVPPSPLPGEISWGFLLLLPTPALEHDGYREATASDFTVALADLPGKITGRADLILPTSHGLESWGQVDARRGSTGLIQPALEPMHDTRSVGDILLALLDQPGSYQEHLMSLWGGLKAEQLGRGYWPAPEMEPPEPRSIQAPRIAEILAPSLGESEEVPAVDLVVVPPRNGSLRLLQEIPDPLASVTYGHWLAVSEAEARREGWRDGDRLLVRHRAFPPWELPIRIQPGLPDAVRTVPLASECTLQPGWTNEGGLNLLLRDIELVPTGTRTELPILSGSPDHGRERGFLARLKGGHHHHDASLYPEQKHDRYHWAMAIDLARCTGCSACVAACYLENNVPWVGEEEHRKGREMSWLRIQPYRGGNGLIFVPMMCQHCDRAPCEPVCPVYATYHNPEGLNAQVYNRCVGTRYCANNCPYKARRFNWFEHPRKAPLDLLTNPEVSERPKGVMEKCSFCIQRIRSAKDKAAGEDRRVRDGEAVPACAQTCPTGAITFGSLADPDSRISKLVHSSRAYQVLEELGTRPSVYYLKDPHRGGSSHGA